MAFSTSGQWLALASSWFNKNNEAAAFRSPATRASFTNFPLLITCRLLLMDSLVLTVIHAERGLRPATPAQSISNFT